MTILALLIFYIFINNWILVKFLGLCPFIGVSKNSENAIGMGKPDKELCVPTVSDGEGSSYQLRDGKHPIGDGW